MTGIGRRTHRSRNEMFASRYMPCPHCGASVDTCAGEAHVCDEERLVDYRLFHLRDEIAAFDAQLATFFASARGRFELWYAARERLRGGDAPSGD